MAKKKDSIALFEVISKQRAKPAGPNVSVPRWMGKAGGLAEAAPPPEQAKPEPAAPPPAAPAPKPPPPKPPAQSPSSARYAPAKPAVGVESGRLKFSLDYVSGTLLAAAALVLLLVAFALGWWSAPTPEGPAGETPAETPQGPGKTAAKKATTPPKPPPKTRAPLLQSGRYYLVIQSLQGMTPQKLKDARQIEKFCNQNNVPATVVTYRSRRGAKPTYMVWSRRPFRLAETLGNEASKHAAMVEELGQRYNSTYGGYSFKQSRNPRGQVEGWFLKYEKGK